MIIGLTGGIGSGKSLVSGILEKEYGFFVIQTDRVAADLMRSDAGISAQLKAAFGEDIYRPDGSLDKIRYAQLIYSDLRLQEISDRIVHPAVWKETDRILRLRSAEMRNAAVETALPGTSLRELCDAVWHVHAERNVRIARLMETRNYTAEYAASVMNRQPSDAFYLAQADRILDNNGTVEELREEIGKIL